LAFNMETMKELKNDFEKAGALQALLIARATGGNADDYEFTSLRSYFVQSNYEHLLPSWLKSNRTLEQFWPFIQTKFPTYKERREFICYDLSELMDATENNAPTPVEKSMSEIISNPSNESIIQYWHKCTERVLTDPEGAVTLARTLVETVLKHIVADLNIQIEKRNPGLPELYSAVAKKLNLSPQNHKEDLIKKILSGCNSVVSGIGELRNLYGDAHGKGRTSVKIEPRHAHLAVNLAGSMASFLIETAETAKKSFHSDRASARRFEAG
jgi:hypothetical protein